MSIKSCMSCISVYMNIDERPNDGPGLHLGVVPLMKTKRHQHMLAARRLFHKLFLDCKTNFTSHHGFNIKNKK